MCRCIVSRYNYARMSLVRASRIVRTRYFNENWLQLAATTLIVDGSCPKFLALESHGARARDAEISRRTATRSVRRAATRRCGRAFIFILENRKRPPRTAVSRVVEETTNTSNSFQGLRLSPRLVAARSKDPIVRFAFASILFRRGILPEKLWAKLQTLRSDRTAPNEILGWDPRAWRESEFRFSGDINARNKFTLQSNLCESNNRFTDAFVTTVIACARRRTYRTRLVSRSLRTNVPSGAESEARQMIFITCGWTRFLDPWSVIRDGLIEATRSNATRIAVSLRIHLTSHKSRFS